MEHNNQLREITKEDPMPRLRDTYGRAPHMELERRLGGMLDMLEMIKRDLREKQASRVAESTD
jgi:hypothetical protein